jgi:two-component sensor histidine kinase
MEAALRRIYRARQAPDPSPVAPPASAGAAEGLQRIAAIVESSERVAAALREKDALLREFHHRVNNNMQLISSLFQLQASTIANPEMLECFEEFGGRIRTMALIHQKIDRAGAVGQVNFKECLETLTDTLLRIHSKGVKVRRQFDIEPTALGIDTAIPVGLIANEIISNSIRHGFAGRQEGLVRVALSRRDPDQYQLAIGDDGCAVAERILEGHSLGLRLVKVLAGQIRGQVEYRNDNGPEFVLEFRDTRSTVT